MVEAIVCGILCSKLVLGWRDHVARQLNDCLIKSQSYKYNVNVAYFQFKLSFYSIFTLSICVLRGNSLGY